MAKTAELPLHHKSRTESEPMHPFSAVQLSFVKINTEVWASRRDSDLEA